MGLATARSKSQSARVGAAALEITVILFNIDKSKFTGEPTNYLDLTVLLLCTRLHMYNVPVAEHVYFNLYDTHIYSLIMKSK